MKLSEPQQQISDSESRMRICAAGRRFGKSFLAINELAKFARHPNRKCLYVAPSYRMARQIIWEDLKNFLRNVKWIKRVNESELTIYLVNNSQIMLRSADNPDSIRGIGVDFLVLDEAADIPKLEDTWQAVLRPTLSDRQGHALIIGSPKGRNFFYDMWVQGGATEDWQSFQFTTLQGLRVPQEEIIAAKRDLDERTFQQEYEARFVDYAGVIYYAFTDDNIKQSNPDDLTPRTPLHVGIDMNINPMSAVIGVINKMGILHIIDEVEIYSSNTTELIKEIKARYPHRIIFAYPDASGQALKTSAAGITDHNLLHNAGFKVKVGKTNPPVVDRINSVNSLLCNSNNERKLFIDPKCKRLRECLIKHTYREGTRQPNKTDGYDHLLDSLGYLVYANFAIRKENLFDDVRGQTRRNTGRMVN